jgi:hypothetical protein
LARNYLSCSATKLNQQDALNQCPVSGTAYNILKNQGENVFGLLRKRVSAEQLAASLTRNAVGFDGCCALVSMMREHTVADEIAIFEFAFLRASYLRSVLAEHYRGAVLKRMTEIVDREVIAAFTGKERSSSRDTVAYYQRQKMSDVAKARLAAYRELKDSLALTSPMFCARVGARNVVMNVEVQAMINDLLGPPLRKSLTSVRPV